MHSKNVQACDQASGGRSAEGKNGGAGDLGEVHVRCDPVQKYIEMYVGDEVCFEGVSNYFKQDVQYLEYGKE